MWQTKLFKTFDACQSFMRKHEHEYQMTLIYVQNGYGVEYKKIRCVY